MYQSPGQVLTKLYLQLFLGAGLWLVSFLKLKRLYSTRDSQNYILMSIISLSSHTNQNLSRSRQRIVMPFIGWKIQISYIRVSINVLNSNFRVHYKIHERSCFVLYLVIYVRLFLRKTSFYCNFHWNFLVAGQEKKQVT